MNVFSCLFNNDLNIMIFYLSKFEFYLSKFNFVASEENSKIENSNERFFIRNKDRTVMKLFTFFSNVINFILFI